MKKIPFIFLNILVSLFVFVVVLNPASAQLKYNGSANQVTIPGTNNSPEVSNPNGMSTASSGGATVPSSYCKNFKGKLDLNASGTTFASLFSFFTCLLTQSIVPLLFGIALLVFIFGTFKFMFNTQSAEREQGKMFMLWGVIAIAVMLSVWGLASILTGTFGIKNSVPQLPEAK